jgi:hypothetical protein
VHAVETCHNVTPVFQISFPLIIDNDKLTSDDPMEISVHCDVIECTGNYTHALAGIPTVCCCIEIVYINCFSVHVMTIVCRGVRGLANQLCRHT